MTTGILRRPALLTAACLALAASPAGSPKASPSGPPAATQPVTGPAAVPSNTIPQMTDAPVPDPDVRAVPSPSESGTRVSPGLFSPRDFNSGQGYLSGSTNQGEQLHKLQPTPGVNLKVPLQ